VADVWNDIAPLQERGDERVEEVEPARRRSAPTRISTNPNSQSGQGGR
jgi:hypothetical protein